MITPEVVPSGSPKQSNIVWYSRSYPNVDDVQESVRLLEVSAKSYPHQPINRQSLVQGKCFFEFF